MRRERGEQKKRGPVHHRRASIQDPQSPQLYFPLRIEKDQSILQKGKGRP